AQANNLSVANSNMAAEHMRLRSHQDNLLADHAQIYAQTLAIDTPRQLSTAHARIQANDLQLNAASIRNRWGQLVHTGVNPFVIQTGELDNQGGLIAAMSAIALRAGSINNQAGKLQASER